LICDKEISKKVDNKRKQLNKIEKGTFGEMVNINLKKEV